MNTWKKIAALFALSLSTGVFGVACAANVEDPGAPKDSAEVTDQAEAADLSEEAVSSGESALDEHDRDIGHGRRCEERCQREYRECMREDFNFRRCQRLLRRCVISCPRR